MKKRLGIYATYDKQGIVDEYIVYYLEEIKKVLDCLVIVSNHSLSNEMKSKLSMADYIYERDDTGFDAGGFAAVINDFVGLDKIKEFDEVVFMNDSVFGPFYSFQEIFDEMDKKEELDFWGLIKRAESDFDGGEVIYPEHIQLFFYVVRKRMLSSKVFETFWKEITNQLSTFRCAIINYEFAFTKYFENAGFSWGVYIELLKYDTRNPHYNLSPYHYASYELISKKRFPVMKRKLVTGDFVDLGNGDRSDLTRIFEFIKEKNNYDVDLIWKHILRVYSLDEIIDGMSLKHIFSDVSENSSSNSKGVILNLGEDNDKYEPLDIEIVNEYSEILNQNYVLIVINDDEEVLPYSLKCAKEYCIQENLLGGFANIVRLFETDSRLGVIIPPCYVFGKMTDSILRVWSNANVAEKLYSDLQLKVPWKKDKAPIHKVEALWCRKELLSEYAFSLLKKDKTGTMLQMMPLVAQQKGFYTKEVMSQRYAVIQLTNAEKVMEQMLQAVKIQENSNLHQIEDQVKGQTLKMFCELHEKIYIYGAGQLACRVAKILKNYKEISGFLVTTREDNVDELYGKKVIAIDDLETQNRQVGIIIAVGEKHNENVLKTLKDYGYEKCYVF